VAVILAGVMYFNSDMVIVQNNEVISETTSRVEEVIYDSDVTKAPETTLPFVKNNNFDYSWLTQWMGSDAARTAAGWCSC